MLNIYRVSFIGHREIYRQGEIESRLQQIICDLLRSREYVEFYVGRNGDFDVLTASVIKRVRREFGDHNSNLTLVLPYPIKDIEYYEKYYDDVIIPVSPQTHFKLAITERNNWMVDNSDLLVAYIERKTGGAAKLFEYAQMVRVQTLNLAKVDK